MTKEDFLKNDSSYYGETVDDMDQVMYRNFNGEELKEYVEHHIQEQVKAGVTYEGVGVSSKINDYVDLTTEQAEAHNEEDLDLCSICGDASTVNCTICRTESC